jgi:hypothetical protein
VAAVNYDVAAVNFAAIIVNFGDIVINFIIIVVNFSVSIINFVVIVVNFSNIIVNFTVSIINFSNIAVNFGAAVLRVVDAYRNTGLYYTNKGDNIMTNEDWLPVKEQDLADLIEVWILILSDAAKVAAFGWIQADVADVLDKLNAFLTARAAYVADDSSSRLHAKNAGRDAVKSAMRDFANSSVRYNKRVDDETKERLLNGKRDATRTDVPDPSEIVAFTLENAGYLQINEFLVHIESLMYNQKQAKRGAMDRRRT